MSKITYEHVSLIKVKLDGKHVGTIKELPTRPGKWAYFPKGHDSHGDIFDSQFAVMASLEAE